MLYKLIKYRSFQIKKTNSKIKKGVISNAVQKISFILCGIVLALCNFPKEDVVSFLVFKVF